MKTMVVYSTLTGYTKKVAEAIQKGLPEGTEIYDVKNAPDPSAYDFIAMGFWVDKGGPNKEAAEYMAKISGKKVLNFFTLGAGPDSMHARECGPKSHAAYGADNTIVADWWCQGAIDPKLIEWMMKQPAGTPHSPTPEAQARWAEAAKHPDANDLSSATKVAADAFAKI